MNTRRGFSLAELLVVIAIIGLLASVGLASFSRVQLKARDARRMSDVQSIGKALALYDVNVGAFPISVSTTTLTGSDAVSLALQSAGAIPVVPRDLASPTTEYTYSSNASGNSYIIGFCLNTNSIPGYTATCNNYLKP